MASVDPGEGWRLLEIGETIKWGDEFFTRSSGWVRTDRAGCVNSSQLRVYRRKLEPDEPKTSPADYSGMDGAYFAPTEYVTVATFAKPSRGKVYIAGPMRGRKFYNFPEFDRVGGLLLNAGFAVVSPADLDRAHGFDPWELPEDHDWTSVPAGFDLKAAFHRDIQALADCTHIVLLDGWTSSVGARCEYFAARWLGLQFICEEQGQIIEVGPGWEPVCPVESPASKLSDYLANLYWDSIVAAPEEDAEAESILDEAKRITGGDRQAQYGPPDQDFARTAGMWTALFGDLLKDGARFEPMHVALAMILLKASRQIHQRKRDNWVDVAGYAHCGNVCDEESAKRADRV